MQLYEVIGDHPVLLKGTGDVRDKGTRVRVEDTLVEKEFSGRLQLAITCIKEDGTKVFYLCRDLSEMGDDASNWSREWTMYRTEERDNRRTSEERAASTASKDAKHLLLQNLFLGHTELEKAVRVAHHLKVVEPDGTKRAPRVARL